jgi:phosphatidyl-myo-inositol dimannoside synthase
MRLALFSSTADAKNGYGNITVEYCRELLKQKQDFTLFLPEAERAFHAKYIPEVPAEFSLPPYIFEMKNPKSLLYLRPIDVSKYDIVHSLLDFPYCFLAARSAKKYKKPFIMGSQGTYGVVPLLRFPDRLALEYAYSAAQHIVVPSLYTRKTILAHTKKKYVIDIIHNGVNFSRFDGERDVSAIRAPYEGKTIFLTVGGLKERKGQDLVIEALGILKKSTEDFVYLLVGDGEWKSVLVDCAKKHGVEDKVVFVGAKDGEELVKYFHACDVYVHTPKVVHYNFEGFGIVYLEAGACGKPSVATDAGGVGDAVENGRTGYIVGDGDAEAIADRLHLLMRDDDIRARLGAAGREYARRHNWHLIVRQFGRLYAKMLPKRA